MRPPILSDDDSMILCSRRLRQRWRLLQQRAWQERITHDGAIPWRHRSSMGPPLQRQRRLMLGSSTTAQPQIQPPPLLVDPYQVLQVRRDATRSEIRQAYRKLALWHHPGRASSCRSSRREGARRARLFEMGAAAYETLMDAATRSRCDGLLRDVPAAALLPAGQIHVGAGTNAHTDWQVPPRRQESTATLNSMVWRAATRNEEDCSSLPKAARASRDQYLHRPSLAQVSLTDSEDDGPEHDDDEETERHDNRALHHEDDRTTTAAHNNSLLASMSQGSLDLKVRKSKQQKKKALHHQSRLPPCLLDCGGGSSHDSAATLPALMNSTSTSVNTMVERHFTQGDTDRLFGGPLQLLFRARRWRPFTDPQQVFATVFGSQLFVGHNNHHHERQCHEGDDDDEPPADHESGDTALVSWKDLQHTLAARNNNTARGRGTAVRQADGSLLFTRSRVLHNRRVVRRETVRTDPATGQVSSRVTVTSESFDEEAAAWALARQTARLEQEASCCSEGELCLALKEVMPSCTGFSLEGFLCGADTTWLL